MHERYQRVVLNGQTSSWKLIKFGVLQGSVIGPLFFLIYINDLSDNLESDCKIFADDTSLFYKVFDKHVSRATLNKDLELINNRALHWIVFDTPSNESIKSRIKSIQYKLCIAITGTIQETSREPLYRELGFKWQMLVSKTYIFIKLSKVCLLDISQSTSMWSLLLITRPDLQLKTFYMNFLAELKVLSIPPPLFALENGTN